MPPNNEEDKKIWRDAERLFPDEAEKQFQYRRRARIEFMNARKTV